MSYAVDYYQVQGYLRWFLILMFMVLKAGLIIAVFMHMVWERLALVYFILVPPVFAAHLRCYWFIGSRLDVFSARRALFERVNHCRTGITTSLA